jgi:acyl carrier protein
MSLKDRIKSVVSDLFGCPAEDIKDDTDIRKDLSADDLDVMELAMALEDEFEVEFPDGDEDKLDTIDGIVRYCRDILKIPDGEKDQKNVAPEGGSGV